MGLDVPGGEFGSSGCLGSGREVFIVALRVTRHQLHSRASFFNVTPPQKSLQNPE